MKKVNFLEFFMTLKNNQGQKKIWMYIDGAVL